MRNVTPVEVRYRTPPVERLRYEQDEENADFPTGDVRSPVERVRYRTPPVERLRYEQDKENADFPTGAYKKYVTEGKRKFDEVLRRI